MSYLHDEIRDDTPHPTAYNASNREVTLSTGTILALFFGLALLCALFFGFGYNMGSKSHQAPIVAADPSAPAGTTDFNHFKPAPGAPVTAPSPGYTVPKPPDSATSSQPAVIVRTAPPVSTSTATTPHPVADSVPTPRSVPATEAGLTFTVQVAAVSHQEDADLLVSALKRKNYAVVARTEPQDKLVHIQIGPFASKKDAETMRQRLLADGYNAIVK